jgi:transcriptional regulator with XRE-family HTH domain
MDNDELNTHKEKLGARIKLLREKTGVSGRAFSLKADVEHHQLINIEKGRVDPRYSTLLKISATLEISVQELISF